MDLLLDTNIVLDMCGPWADEGIHVTEAVEKCLNLNARIWLYTGSVQAYEYKLKSRLLEESIKSGGPLSDKTCADLARKKLNDFSKNKQWLSALANEGNIFDCEDLEHEQLIRALDRFDKSKIRLLTRDKSILAQHSMAISPEQYLAMEISPTQLDFIDLKTQQDSIRSELECNIHRVLHHGQYIMGPEVKSLEEKLCTYTASKHCITVASGTEALLISLMALDIKSGDEIITTPFTFIATAEVIVLLGAKPIFVDIEPTTCNIDASKIEAAITPKTRAIIPVSLYGQPSDMDEINLIAAKYNLPVIEDAAQSFGAEYKGKKSCNLSTIGCTSFFPSKPLGCYGDGGAIFTDDDALAQACREIRVHGQSRRYVHTRIGVGGRMDTLQCAVVLAKLKRFDWEVEQRIAVGKRYNELIDEVGIQRVQQKGDRTSVFAQFTVLVERRADVEARLKQIRLPTAVHYPVPLNQQPAYIHLNCGEDTPISTQIAQKVMSLPMGADIQPSSLSWIVQQLKKNA